MYIKNMKGWVKHLDFIILDVIMLELTLLISYGIRHDWSYGGFGNIYQTLAILLALASIGMGILRENYGGILRRDAFRECRKTLTHVTAVEIALVAAAFYLKEFSYSREVFLLLWIIGTALCFLERCVWKQILRNTAVGRRAKRQVLLVTVPELAEQVIKEWNREKVFDCQLCGICLASGASASGEELSRNDGTGGTRLWDDGAAGEEPEEAGSIRSRIPATISGIPVIGAPEQVKDYLLRKVVDEVLIRPGNVLKREYLDEFLQAGMTIHMDVEDIAHGGVPTVVEEFAGGTVITAAMRVVRPWEMWLKRLMDIAGGCVGLALAGVAYVFVAPAILLSDPGPVFFSQIRVGQNGRRFKMYKFRSMYQDAEERKKELMAHNEMKGAMFKMKDDPRVIRGIGQFIRKTSIDELPQFWNVLKGDMSLVGTRPPTEEEYNSYEMRYLRRLSVRPGITGVWQTSGRNKVTDFNDVVKLDTEYITNWSLTMDVKLLFKTVKVVFTEEGAA